MGGGGGGCNYFKTILYQYIFEDVEMSEVKENGHSGGEVVEGDNGNAGAEGDDSNDSGPGLQGRYIYCWGRPVTD